MAAVTSVGRATGLEPLELALDSRSEEALYQRNAARIFGYCLSRLRRREDAEDALQTTFLYAVRSLRRGVVPLVESAWLLGIARNVCLERWEAAGRRSRVETPWDPLALDRGSPAPQESRDDLIGLEDALSRLPEQQRRAILLRDWRGLSYAEVAAQLGVSQAAVETLIFRGRRALAEQLREGAEATTRRRLASLANVGSFLTAVKGAFTGAAALTKIAAAITVVAVSGTGLAVGGASLREGDSAPPRPERERTEVPATPRPAQAVASPSRNVVVGPTVTRPGRRAPSAPPSIKPAPARATPSTAAPAAAETTDPPAPAVETPPAERTVEKLKSSVPPPVTAPVEKAVEKAVDTVLPPTLAAPVEEVVDAVLAPVVAPVEEAVDTVAPALAPVVPQAVDTLVETLPALPVEPVAVVPQLAEPVAVTAPLLP